jgi:hypothetical protein
MKRNSGKENLVSIYWPVLKPIIKQYATKAEHFITNFAKKYKVVTGAIVFILLLFTPLRYLVVSITGYLIGFLLIVTFFKCALRRVKKYTTTTGKDK